MSVWDPQRHEYVMVTSATLYGQVPLWTAPALTGPWAYAGEALPHLPTWASNPFMTWKPALADINGTWTLWGSAGVTATESLCLYRATAPTPTGPFTVDPVVGPGTGCPVAQGGNIDPTPIQDRSGQWWLTYKFNGNVVGQPTVLRSVQLGSDGRPTGPVHDLLTSDLPWEAGLIEAPSFVLNPDTNLWWLTFSAGDFGAGRTYQVVAVPCYGLGGPCVEGYLTHLVAANAQGQEPGEQSVAVGRDTSRWLLYNPAGPFADPALRPLAVARLGFDAAGVPYLGDPGQDYVPSLPSAAVGMAASAQSGGYWLADAQGYVTAHGGAVWHGDMTYGGINAPIIRIVATTDGQGYWLVAADGGIFAFGDAPFYGSMGNQHLNQPVVSMAPTPSGHGYWLVAADGGIFAFGDAAFSGSMGGQPLHRPVVGLAVDATTGGYWEVGSDGGIFSFGAPYLGSTGALSLNAPVNGIAATADGGGYLFVAGDGGIFTYGDAGFHGSTGGQVLNAPVVGVTTDVATGGYWLVAADGGIFNYDAPFYGAG